MGLFDSGVDLIDYTLLKKRGLIKVKEIEPCGVKCDKEGFVDLGSIRQNTASPTADSLLSSSTSSDASASSTPSFASFFGDMGAVAAATENSSSGFSSPTPASEPHHELSSVKVKVEDLEFKLDRLIDRLSSMEDKLREFESKARGN